MTLVEHLREMARNNAWSNQRLLSACAKLTDAEFAAERVGFFPSIRETLNHILTVDWYYLDALVAGGRGLAVFEPEMPFATLPSLRVAQSEADRRLIAFCDGLGDRDLDRVVRIDRGEKGVKEETVASLLPHLFLHQVHHRGQVHGMLAGTDVKPPQLDEFFLFEDKPASTRELEAIGLSRP